MQKNLTLYLGSRCNLNCTYCHRTKDANEPNILASKALNYIEKNQYETIRFIGGEPLLYIDSIKRTIERSPNTKFLLQSNGVLIEKYKEFLRSNNIGLQLSYDFQNNNDYRSFDPFTINLKEYPYCGLSSTITDKNSDHLANIQDMVHKETIVKRSLSYYPHICHNNFLDAPGYAPTRQTLISMVDQTKRLVDMYLTEVIQTGVLNKRFDGLWKSIGLLLKNNYTYGETYCFNKNRAKMDFNGNYVSCLYIRDDILDEDEWQEQQQKIVTKLFPKCKDCDIYRYCGAACIKSVSHEDECFYYSSLIRYFLPIYTQHKYDLVIDLLRTSR